MPGEPVKRYCSVRRFSDPSEHARQQRGNFNQDYVQIEHGAFESRVLHADFDGLQVIAETTNRRMVARAHALPGSIAVGWINGPGSTLIGCSRGGEDWLVTLPAFAELVCITMPAVEFERLVEPLNPAMNSGRKAVFKASGEGPRDLSSWIHDVGRKGQQWSCRDMGAVLRQQLLKGLFELLGQSAPVHPPSLTRLTYSDIVKRSQRLVLENSEYLPSVLDLCAELRVCRRTLQKSFLRVTGRSPSHYIRCVRLNGVRGLLRSLPAAEINVRDAAARWGFLHPGNFASDYRRLFGELPSQTPRADELAR